MSRYQPSSVNYDLVSNCEQYLTKMLRQKKVDQQPTQRLRQEQNQRGRDTSSVRQNTQVAVPRQTVRSGNQVPMIKNVDSRPEISTNELVRKEIFNNSVATVELTVRTQPQQKRSLTAIEKRDTWDKILLKRKSDESIGGGSFNNFDPLRTLHFLSKELQLKLQTLCPDSSVQQIIADMQGAMSRLPSEVLTQLKITDDVMKQPCGGDIVPQMTSKTNDYIEQVPTKDFTSRKSQMNMAGDTIDKRKLQQQLEEDKRKLEDSLKEIESACSKLRREKDELSSQLVIEKETIKTLKQNLETIFSENDNKTSLEIQKVIKERDELKLKVKQIQNELDAQVGPSAQNLRILIQDLRDKQLAAEQENMMIRNELTIMKLERDKMNVLLECKDKQLREMRTELQGIQTMISSSLLQFKTKPTVSPSSSFSSCSQISNVPSSKIDDSIHNLYINSEKSMNNFLSNQFDNCDSNTSTLVDAEHENKIEKNLSVIHEIPSRDSKIYEDEENTSKSSLNTQSEYLGKKSHTSIKDMFAEIKRQAFMTLPSPPHDFKDCSLPDSPGSQSS